MQYLEFDYNCQGMDWVIPRTVTKTMQSPIDIADAQFEENFKVTIEF